MLEENLNPEVNPEGNPNPEAEPDPVVVTDATFFIPQQYPVPQKVADDWEAALGHKSGRIMENIFEVLPDQVTYEARLAALSAVGYKPLVASSFTTRSGLTADEVTTNQESNLRRSYNKFRRAIEFVHSNGGAIFKQILAYKKPNLLEGLAERGMPFTGMRVGVGMLGACSIAVLFLANDRTVMSFIRPADKVKKGPFLITIPRRIPTLKAALMGRLTQAGVQIVKSNYDPTVIASWNTLLNQEAQNFVDPALGIIPWSPGGLTHLDYILDGKQLWLDLKVSRAS